MPSRFELMIEAERRGILPPDKAVILGEARKRGLVQDNQIVRPPKERKDQNFFERVGSDIGQRSQNIEEIKQFTRTGKQTAIEGGLQQAGQAAGGIFDVVSEGLISTGRGISAVTPEFVKDELSAGVNSLKDDPIIQFGFKAIEKGADAWKSFKDTHPRAARNIEASVNVGMLITPVKKPQVKADMGLAGKGARELKKAAISQRKVNKQSFIDDLVRPEQTKTNRMAQVARTDEKGLFKSKVISPSKSEIEMSKVIRNLDISPGKTLQGNYNVIAEAVVKEAGRLKGRLSKSGITFSKNEFGTALGKMKADLAKHPLLVGDAKKTADNLLSEYQKILDDVEMTPSGLLEARKRFDGYIVRTRPAAFDPKDSAFNVVVKGIRNTTNDFISSKVPSLEVKSSLRRQHNLLSAMDNITPKAANEANNTIQRTWDRLTSILPIRNKMIQEAATFTGIGGLGASAVFAPVVRDALAVAALGYAGHKMVASPQAKEALGMILKYTDEAIRISKDKALVKELRADRAILLDVLGSVEKDQTQPGENKTPTEGLKGKRPALESRQLPAGQ